MDCIGNDVVWLADPSNRRRSDDSRLVSRILRPEESALLASSIEPDRCLWSLWAAKEAGFKAWVQAHPGSVFSPSSFEVVPASPDGPLTSGRVVHKGESFPVVWSHGSDWVNAVAAHDQNTIVSRVEARSGNASEAVRNLAVELLTASGFPRGRVDGRPPRYTVDGQEFTLGLSLSHDGPYFSVAFRCLR